jgi:hypothetical protein
VHDPFWRIVVEFLVLFHQFEIARDDEVPINISKTGKLVFANKILVFPAKYQLFGRTGIHQKNSS